MVENEVNAFFGKRAFCIVTGASRGLGWKIAEKLAETVGNNSTLIVTARGLDKLKELKSKIDQTQPKLRILVSQQDMYTSFTPEYKGMLTEALNETNSRPSDYQVAIVVHNCATTDAQMNNKKLIDQNQAEEITRYFHGNVTSMICLNSQFVDTFKEVENKLIVQMSSLAAVSPIHTFGLTGAGKAARDMYIKCLVSEEPTLRAINYAPGVVDTEILRFSRDHCCDSETKSQIADAMAGKAAPFKVISVDEAVDALFAILKANKFENGAHVDVCQKEALC